MNRKRVLAVAAVASFTVAVVVAAAGVARADQLADPGGPGGPGRGRFGGPGPRGPGMGPLMGLPRDLAERLDVTEAQHERIRAILGQHREEGQSLAERVGQATKAQEDAVMAEYFDEGAIRAAAAELAAAQTDLAVFQGRVHAETFQVLTPEQQATARELRAQRDARAQERAKRLEQRRNRRRPERP